MSTKRQIRAIIVDDERGVRELLRLLLEKHCEQVVVIGEAANADDAYKEINSKNPDLIFLDIQMPKGDGFSLLEKFKNPNFEIIFTTSYSQYAIGAIKANALDYLLKPYDISELKLAVNKVEQKKYSLIEGKSREIYIQVHMNYKVEQVSTKYILYFEAQNNYTLIKRNDGTKHLIARVLAEVEEIVKPLDSFLRIHRSVIINRDFIKNYSKVPPYFITLNNDETFEVSRRKRAEIIELLRNY